MVKTLKQIRDKFGRLVVNGVIVPGTGKYKARKVMKSIGGEQNRKHYRPIVDYKGKILEAQPGDSHHVDIIRREIMDKNLESDSNITDMVMDGKIRFGFKHKKTGKQVWDKLVDKDFGR